MCSTFHTQGSNNHTNTSNALAASALTFGESLELMPDATLSVNLAGQIMLLNEQAERLFGYTRAELIGQSLEILIPVRFHDRHPQLRANFFARPGKRPMGSGLELYALCKDGAEFPVDISLSHYTLHGQLFALCAVRDLTERKRLEQALRASEEKYRLILENIDQVVYSVKTSADTPLTGLPDFVSGHTANIIGYSAQEFIQDPTLWARLVHPDDVAPLLARTAELYRQRQSGVREYRLRHKTTGEYHWVADHITSQVDAKGQLVGIFGVARDITEQKQAELALRRRADEFAALYDIAHELALQRDLPTLLQTIVARATALAQTAVGAIFLYDAAQQHLELVVANDAQLPLGSRLRLDEGLVGQTAQTREALIVNNYQRWAHALPQLVARGIKAVASVPMVYGGELIGVLLVSITGESERQFTNADVRLLTLFASQAASAVHNARLLEETRQRLAELEAVSKVSTALRVAQTLDEMLPLLLDETLAVIGYNAGAVWLHDEPRDELTPMVARGWFQDTLAKTKPHEGIAGRVFATNEAHVTREFATDPHLRESVRPQVPRGWGGACVPIRSVSAIVGVLFVSAPLPRELAAGELRLLHTLSEMAGNAIQRTRLHEQTERRLEQLAALRNIDVAISSSVELRVTLGVFISQALAPLRADAIAVWLLKSQTHTLEYVAGHGFRQRSMERAQLRLGEGMASRAALERSIVTIPNLSKVAAPTAARAELLAQEGFFTYHAVPLLAKGQVNGVLEVFHRAAFEADADWLDFLETLARQAAIAIDNARLFQSLQHSNADLMLAYDTTLEGWSRALDLRDKETEGHTQRVTEMTLRLARAMGLGEAELVHIRRGALLHDIGKMGVPDAILLKPDKLTDEEWVIMRKHPVYAYELLQPIAYLHPALDIPYCHHEKWDGTGYPRSLQGEEIPLGARLFAVVDVWDALRSDRPYRASWPLNRVLEHIRSLSGSHFDPRVVEVFLSLMSSSDLA